MASSGQGQIPLQGGFYSARSVIANIQRCVNLYPEKNPEDSPAPYTMYPTPGLKLLSSPPAIVSTFRCLWTATNGQLFGVIGQNVYYISPNWTFTLLGILPVGKTTPVSMVDNSITLFIVDGSSTGYTVTLQSDTTQYNNTALTNINDPNFFGADRCDILDGFALFNLPGSRAFYSSLDYSTTFDPLYIAAKSGYPDNLASIIVMHREIWLLGAQNTTEIWNNVGNANFPFAIIPGVFIEHGCAAKYSVAKHDLTVFWLSVDKDGVSTVFQGQNYGAKRISTPAIAAQFSKYPTVSDAIGMTYKQQDHVFYVLTFPSADRTWVFDASENLWHERSFTDSNGIEHRHRANCMAFAYGVTVCGDFQNGNLYQLDLDTYTDYASSIVPIVRRRGFRHLISDGKLVEHKVFRADMDNGTGLSPSELQNLSPFSAGFSSGFGPVTQYPPDQVYLVWSDTRGHNWGQAVGQPIGATGDFLVQAQWRNLGAARDRVYELFWAAPLPTSLQGAWIETKVATQ